ncbi:hypothetical protein PF001_g19339 [Phytophthora fragariae]|uniref:Uncharacterized protein n=2 Tax=Phytophthora fragariae TaxID=53985 RepID=A0A6A4CIK4_9STRA|nr:hypothetical protein PF001_g19339 [Phytophthora fragariae]
MATSKVVHTAKVNMAVAAGNDYDDESNDGEEADAPHVPPPPKKAKFAARRSKAATRQVTAMEASGKSTVAAPPQDATTVVDGEGKMMNDGSVAVVRRAVTAQLDEKLAARDEGRAERYVCTVRPAMAALRYVHSADESAKRGPGGGVSEKAMTTDALAHSEEVAASEEGGDVCGRRRPDEHADDDGRQCGGRRGGA